MRYFIILHWQLQTASFRKDHDTILTSLGNIAFAKAKKGETTNALQVRVSLQKDITKAITILSIS